MTKRFALPFNASLAIAPVGALIGAILVAAPLWTDTPGVLPAAGIVGFSIAMWATGAMPQHIVALIMFVVTVIFEIAPPNVAFGGFHSSATWLVFGGIIITLAAQRSGFANRMVQMLVTQLPPRYFGMAAGIAVAGMLLSFIMPSASGRVVLMAPLALALADRLGFAENSQARYGLVLAAGWGATVPAFGILPSNVVNLALVGSAESIHGISFTYFGYTLLNYPVLGIVNAALMAALVTFLFGAKPSKQQAAAPSTSWSGAEKRLLLIMLAALILWMTDSWHGVSPAWIAMVAALLCIAPGIGIMPSKVLSSDINYAPWIFVAGIIGMGLIANDTGLGAEIGKLLLAHAPLTKDGGLIAFYEIFAIGGALGMVTTFPAAPPIMTAFADAIAQGTGWPLEAVLLAEVPSWMIYPLPHQAPPLAIAMVLGGVPLRAGAKLLIPHFILGVIFILPLQYWWGHTLGMYP